MVDWVKRGSAPEGPASDEQVRAAEEALRVRFPADYLAVAQPLQGATPRPASIDLPDDFTTDVGALLHFAERPVFTNIVTRRDPLADVLDKGIVPFAEDIGGDLFCFNYRDTPDRPSVCFYSADSGVIELAPDFTAFTALLHD